MPELGIWKLDWLDDRRFAGRSYAVLLLNLNLNDQLSAIQISDHLLTIQISDLLSNRKVLFMHILQNLNVSVVGYSKKILLANNCSGFIECLLNLANTFTVLLSERN
jgi:hypothetical protein